MAAGIPFRYVRSLDVQIKDRTRSMPLPECQLEKPRGCMLTDPTPSMPLPESSSMPSLYDLPSCSSRHFESTEGSGKSGAAAGSHEAKVFDQHNTHTGNADAGGDTPPE